MDTVLGLSLTSNSVAWVLLDGPGADAATLDHDVFDISVGSVDDGDIATYVAAVKGVQAIAATSGHELTTIALTWTADAGATPNLLLKSLPDLGFEKVVSARLSEAAAAWAQVFDAAFGFEKAAVCVVEPSAATLLSFGHGAVHTSATHTRESDDGLSRWLKDAFDTNHLDPEHLFLIGSRGDVELISGRLSETLDMSIVTSNEAQLILARGTALIVGSNAETVAVPMSGEQHAAQKQTTAGALGQPAWFSPPVRAAVALVAGVVALFVLGPMLLSQPEPSSAEDRPASNPSATSVGIQAVPALPLPPPAKEVVKRVMQTAPAPRAPSPSPPPAAEVSAPEATAEPPAVPAGVPHLPAQIADVPAETAHLPAEGTPHLPGTAPVLAAGLPTAEGVPAPPTPTQAAPVPVWSALP